MEAPPSCRWTQRRGGTRSEHDEPEIEKNDAEEADVEAHGLREAAVTGLTAAALIAGAGAGQAAAATSPGHAAAASKQAVHKIDAANKGAAVSKDAVFKGAAIQKGATFKGNSVSKFAISKEAVSKFAVSKESVDPSSRRGRDASSKIAPASPAPATHKSRSRGRFVLTSPSPPA